MDRAHRLGQTRTVNVYRLLMRGTLEERVMGLQQFKLDVANAVSHFFSLLLWRPLPLFRLARRGRRRAACSTLAVAGGALTPPGFRGPGGKCADHHMRLVHGWMVHTPLPRRARRALCFAWPCVQIINQENMSLAEMDTGRLLDLFGGDGKQQPQQQQQGQQAAPAAKPSSGVQAMLAGLGELSDEREYEAQFNMAAFMQKLGKQPGR